MYELESYYDAHDEAQLYSGLLCTCEMFLFLLVEKEMDSRRQSISLFRRVVNIQVCFSILGNWKGYVSFIVTPVKLDFSSKAQTLSP